MSQLVRRIAWPGKESVGQILSQEWIVTNGLGGYASCTVAGVITRRFHGLLISALPSPFGRRMYLNEVAEELHFPDGHIVRLGGEYRTHSDVRVHGAEYLSEFRLEMGLPAWIYQVEGITLEKRLVMPARQNTVLITYEVICGECDVRLELRPAMHFRPHEGVLSSLQEEPYEMHVVGDRYDFGCANPALPPLRMRIEGSEQAFTFDREFIGELVYHTEEVRGYESRGHMWSPGFFQVRLTDKDKATLMATTETWETACALPSAEVLAMEYERRSSLLTKSNPKASEGLGPELVLAADQFVITPVGRMQDVARAHAAGDEVRTVIAGYHWFTDWGRDTMISLEGLTLTTGRQTEAGWILRTFAYYMRDGLIPNMFPEGENEGLYHTADATLWFFHALDRYVEATRRPRDAATAFCRSSWISCEASSEGTRFGIGVDPADGLLRQGAGDISSPGWMPKWMTGWSRRGAARRWRSTRSGTTRCACWRMGCGVAGDDGARSSRSRPREPATSSTGASGMSRAATVTTWWTASRATTPRCDRTSCFAISLEHPGARRSPMGAGVRDRAESNW